ncbi:MAG: transcription repressor NadR [Eubacteriales bacterium]|nr:transcription repressor NadR [Eubacteriales bacterium]
MDGDRRRREIVKILGSDKKPISGTVLAGRFGVSRQVIVQDIALLRATDKNILSTNKGYMLYEAQESGRYKRTFAVCHKDDETKEELYLIVDCGAQLRDVVIEHDVYGQISVDLIITSRKDADEFLKKMDSGKDKPLKELSDGIHYHTVEASDEAILDAVEQKLKEHGFLLDFHE